MGSANFLESKLPHSIIAISIKKFKVSSVASKTTDIFVVAEDKRFFFVKLRN